MDPERKAPMCSVRDCPREHDKGRTVCGYHRNQAWRLRNPVRGAWIALRAHAKQRGRTFTLVLESFRELCHRTRYHELTGNYPHSLTIDRIDPRRGYEPDNIQVITRSANCAKAAQDKVLLRQSPRVQREPDEG